MRWHRSSGNAQPAKPKRQHVRLGVGVAVAIAALLAAWVLIDDNESGDTAKAGISTEAEIVSVDSLRKAAGTEETPIYWAGQTAGTDLELSQPAPDRTYVRYLPTGVEAGDPKPFLTVSSYSFEDPTAALRSRSQEPGGVLATAPGNGTVYFSREDPKSVYLAYPETEVEIEVFAPEFKEALELATSGHIVPVD
jgi:hypothetical protein